MMDPLAPRYPAMPGVPLTEARSTDSGLISLSDIVFGAGVFGYDYNTPDTLQSDIPAQCLRLFFRYGGNAIDTSPYYTASETTLGVAFAALSSEFPRESYQIITKAGRYGRTAADGFDYSPATIRASVARSCERMQTSYVDVVYMHDVEFVSEQIGGAGEEGYTVDEQGKITEEDLVRWGLAPGDEANVRGPGDQKVLDAVATLFELKDAGVIRAAGFSGFPLPTLLRLARLVKAKLGRPLDIMQSYCHLTLHNDTLVAFLPLFHEAGVARVVSASPLSMGLLREAGPQSWHPASPELLDGSLRAGELCRAAGETIERVALEFGLESVVHGAGKGEQASHRPAAIALGLSKPEEVHEAMEMYDLIRRGKHVAPYTEALLGSAPPPEVKAKESEFALLEDLSVKVRDIYTKNKSMNWTWPVPPKEILVYA